jgi:fumarate hydratase class II
MGSIDVPSDSYYGAQSARSLINFNIGRETMPPEMIRALGILKKSAAQANFTLGKLTEEQASAISQAADEVLI